VLVCFTVFVGLPLLLICVWSVQDWNYTRFCCRSQDYYARVADACDQLLTLSESLPRKIRTEELSTLPAILRELNTTSVIVDTNIVVVMLGAGQLSHQLVWSAAPDGSIWRLTRGTPETGKSRVIFSRSRLTQAQTS